MKNATRLLAAAGTTTITYIMAVIALKPLISPESRYPRMMMDTASSSDITLNIAALLVGVVAGLAAYMLTGPKEKDEELRIAKKTLSADEKALLEEVEKAGEITQDSLRFRLNWSKAKTSSIITNLDRMNLVQRERQGRTYNLFLTKKP